MGFKALTIKVKIVIHGKAFHACIFIMPIHKPILYSWFYRGTYVNSVNARFSVFHDFVFTNGPFLWFKLVNTCNP